MGRETCSGIARGEEFRPSQFPIGPGPIRVLSRHLDRKSGAGSGKGSHGGPLAVPTSTKGGILRPHPPRDKAARGAAQDEAPPWSAIGGAESPAPSKRQLRAISPGLTERDWTEVPPLQNNGIIASLNSWVETRPYQSGPFRTMGHLELLSGPEHRGWLEAPVSKARRRNGAPVSWAGKSLRCWCDSAATSFPRKKVVLRYLTFALGS